MMGLESGSKKLEVASTQSSTLSRLGGDSVATTAVLRLTCAGWEMAKRAHPPPGTRSAMMMKDGY